MRDLINIIEVIIIARALWKTIRYLLGKKKHKSLIGKVWLLISKQLHSNLDIRLYEQNKRLAETTRQAKAKNIVQFAKYKRKVN